MKNGNLNTNVHKGKKGKGFVREILKSCSHGDNCESDVALSLVLFVVSDDGD